MPVEALTGLDPEMKLLGDKTNKSPANDTGGTSHGGVMLTETNYADKDVTTHQNSERENSVVRDAEDYDSIRMKHEPDDRRTVPSVHGENDVIGEEEDVLPDVRVSELMYREYCVRYKRETKSEVTSIAVTRHECHMIVCDHMNGTINLVDKQFRLVFKYHSCFKAFGAAVLDASFFVVTFPFVRLMQYFKFKDSYTKFAPWFPVKAQNEYYGVCGVDDRIVAVCKYDGDNRKDIPGVHILNRQGYVLNIITKDQDDKQLFVDPEYIAINNATRAVYVSDSGTCAVVCINLAGEVLSIFRARYFLPTGVTIDDSMGTVYVNDVCSESVVSFNQQLEVRLKIKAKREKLAGLLCATYCIKSDRLIVSMDESLYLKAFTL